MTSKQPNTKGPTTSSKRPRETKRGRRAQVEPQDDDFDGGKKDKKLVFLSKSVL